MTYQDQRNDEHPEAVRSDPVPVQRTAPDDEVDRDTDRDGIDDRTEADRGRYESGPDESDKGYHDSAASDEGRDDTVAADSGYHDNATTDADTDADRDGVDDRVEDAEVRDETDVYQQAEDDRVQQDRTEDERTVDERAEDERTDDERTEDERAEDERTGYDEPVIASPVDTDVERSGVDSTELDRDRAEDDRTFGGPTFPESALAPAAFGAATMGGAAAAAAMAANRTDTRTDAEVVDERADADRVGVDGIGDDRTPDEVAVVADTADEEPTELMPGQVDAEPVTALIAVEAAQGFRDRWREVQLRFVDDPRGAAGEAQGLAEEAADALVAALDAIRSDLGGWEATEGADTEHLRVVVRRYRDFLDRVLQS
jgi:hypothetical protein